MSLLQVEIYKLYNDQHRQGITKGDWRGAYLGRRVVSGQLPPNGKLLLFVKVDLNGGIEVVSCHERDVRQGFQHHPLLGTGRGRSNKMK